MKTFMGRNFLLTTEKAKELYHEFAEDMPIIDYHCHLDPKEIYEDKRFSDIAEVWLGGDHYKWRLMRAAGVPERYITGDAPGREKFRMYAETLEKAIGNPLYHWSHLELKRYFGYEGVLNGETAETVWQLAEEKLQDERFSARNLIRRSDVDVICTTDDPADTLEYHKLLREDRVVEFKVYPTFRPDKAVNIENAGYPEYIEKLAAAAKEKIHSFADLVKALLKRMDYFKSLGCRVSDHGLSYVPFERASAEEVEAVFEKAMEGTALTEREIRLYKTALLLELGKAYAERGFVMQIHYNVQRNVDRKRFLSIGPDAGFDCMDSENRGRELAQFMNALAEEDALPKTILYSLNPNDDALLDTIAGSFQDESAVSKVQHGSAWWFNDHKEGMKKQLTSLANIGLLGGFVGMLTDSRSFLSYARHEYFRRILCDFIGGLVENGEYPDDPRALEKIVEGICYYNAKKYFGF
ncbi:MAG: glucuronate isomerase [Lachnospiraceae bacterium]|nr:glucuronate isomerase [Lachnospiraceae bacterium]